MNARPWTESVIIHLLGFALIAVAVAPHLKLDTVGPRHGPTLVSVSLRGPVESAKPRLRSPRSAPHAVTVAAAPPARAESPAAEALSELVRSEVPGASPDAPGAAASGPVFDAYLARIRAQIDRSIVYPASFRARRLSGSVILHLVLDHSGVLRENTVATSSGNAELDRFAIAAVAAAGPFPASPRPFSQTLSFNLPIELKMR